MSLLFRLVALAAAALAFLGAAVDMLRGRAAPVEVRVVRYRRTRLIIKTAWRTIVVLAVLSVIGGFAYMYSGFYDIAANEPHLPPVRWALETGRTRSVEFHSRSIQAPPLRRPAMVEQGFMLYRENCEPCHGAPGVPRAELGRGINPTPPPLFTTIAEWSDPQLYWIISNGLKMSGMPAFGEYLSEDEQWSLVAFLRSLAWVGPREYRALVQAVDTRAAGETPPAVDWLPRDDHDLGRLAAADRQRGRALLREQGCAACHTIPGIRETHVGPPLSRFAERHFIAGSLVNTPANAVGWITNPRHVRPQTAMPDVGTTPDEALDMAAYLFSLGDQRRLEALRRSLQD